MEVIVGGIVDAGSGAVVTVTEKCDKAGVFSVGVGKVVM